IAKKHQKPTRSTMQGGIIDKEMPMPVANVAIICPACSKPTRIGYRFEPDGTKVRICRKCEGDLA
ncbi:MAG: 50S ribosomal protein L24, partial [Acidimicrobiales bacterium]